METRRGIEVVNTLLTERHMTQPLAMMPFDPLLQLHVKLQVRFYLYVYISMLILPTSPICFNMPPSLSNCKKPQYSFKQRIVNKPSWKKISIMIIIN